MTREMLDDLLVDVPRQVVPDIDAAWRSGTRRRRRAYGVGTGVVLALALVVGVGVMTFDPKRSVQPADGPDGYPREVSRPIVLTRMPERPGPMAGVLQLFGIGDWTVFDARGRSWLVPGISQLDDDQPMLSDDGRMLGYLRTVSEDRSEFVLWDLVSGEQTVVPEVGDGRLLDEAHLTDQPYSVDGQSPGLWSPDDQWLATVGGPRDAKGGWGPLLMGVDGRVQHLPVRGWLVGWLAADRLAVVRANGELIAVDPDGTIVDRVELEVPAGREIFGQWSGRVSADGSRVAIVSEKGAQQEVSTFDTATGGLLYTYPWSNGFANSCLLGWQGDEVLAWNYEGSLVEISSGERVVTTYAFPGDLGCAVVAAEALAGPVQEGPGILEWRYWDVIWWWRWILGAVVVLLVGGCVWFVRRTRRRLDHAT